MSLAIWEIYVNLTRVQSGTIEKIGQQLPVFWVLVAFIIVAVLL